MPRSRSRSRPLHPCHPHPKHRPSVPSCPPLSAPTPLVSSPVPQSPTTLAAVASMLPYVVVQNARPGSPPARLRSCRDKNISQLQAHKPFVSVGAVSFSNKYCKFLHYITTRATNLTLFNPLVLTFLLALRSLLSRALYFLLQHTLYKNPVVYNHLFIQVLSPATQSVLLGLRSPCAPHLLIITLARLRSLLLAFANNRYSRLWTLGWYIKPVP